jgi:hypothetical protein
VSTCSESPRSGRSWQLRRSCPAPRSRYPNTEAGEVVAASLGGCSDKAVAVAACDRRRDDPAGQLPEKPLDLGDGNYSSCPKPAFAIPFGGRSLGREMVVPDW